MSNINFGLVITAEQKAAQILIERIEVVKAECRQRIFAAASQTTQMNLTAASSADRLSPEQKAMWAAALQWVDDMRAACPPLIGDPNADYTLDSVWPALPDGVAALVAQF